MLAAIPYKTFPKIAIGPLELRTFGLMVGLGVLVGAWLAARHIEKYGISRDESYRLATRMVVVGVVGARLSWDLSHWDQIDSPLDLIAVWQGGLQFSGGFVGAVLVGYPTFRKWTRALRWHVLDGYAYGLTLGLAIGRIGCTSVGEHFGSLSNFFLAVRYEGGATREPTIGSVPLVEGMTFHNTAIYELLYLLVLFGVLTLLIRRGQAAAGTVMGVFCLYYGTARGLSDFIRVNDDTVLGLTGAQYLMFTLIPIGVWILTKVRRATAALEAAAEPASAAFQPPDPSAAAAPAPAPEPEPTDATPTLKSE